MENGGKPEMKNYIICAPRYSLCGRSNGVKALYRLAELLRERGYQAYMYSDKNASQAGKITDKMRKNDIVIYPEVVYGNPLQFQNVVRWVLYYPGQAGGDTKYDDYEKIFTWQKKYMSGVPELCIPTLDTGLFYKDETPKDVDCYFVYKRGKWREIPEFDSMIEINAHSPATRQELGTLLRRTKTLYSYDKDSLLLDEAERCGCTVKLVEPEGFSDYISSSAELFKDWEKKLEYFINTTQQMQYSGRIAPAPPNYSKFIKCTIKSFLYKYILFNKEKARGYDFWP